MGHFKIRDLVFSIPIQIFIILSNRTAQHSVYVLQDSGSPAAVMF